MGARIICVGDPNQALYRFRGADCHAFDRLAEMFTKSDRGMIRRELPINYRCDQAIIRHASQWVPALKGASTSKGTVDSLTFGEAMERANNNGTDIELPDGVEGTLRSLPLPGRHTTFAFLCRINLPLVITAYQLISQGKRCCIIGRKQIGAPLKNLIETLCGTDPSSPGYTDRISDKKDHAGDTIEEGLLTRLTNYFRVQVSKMESEGMEKKLEALQQNVECIEVIAMRVQSDSVAGVLNEIDTLFVEDEEKEPGTIALSTIHRAKGLEWDVVFILRPDLMPHPLAKPNPDGSWSDEQQQEQNAQYVAWTRARHRAYAVVNWPFGTSSKVLSFERPSPTSVDNDESETAKDDSHLPIGLRRMTVSDSAQRQFREIMSSPATGDFTPQQVPEVPSSVVQEKLVDDGEPF